MWSEQTWASRRRGEPMLKSWDLTSCLNFFFDAKLLTLTLTLRIPFCVVLVLVLVLA